MSNAFLQPRRVVRHEETPQRHGRRMKELVSQENSMEYMETKMHDQIEGAQSQYEEACNEAAYLRELVEWAYGKLHYTHFSKMDDALMLDRMKLYMEHGIAS